jgi:hypothetical protein
VSLCKSQEKFIITVVLQGVLPLLRAKIAAKQQTVLRQASQ